MLLQLLSSHLSRVAVSPCPASSSLRPGRGLAPAPRLVTCRRTATRLPDPGTAGDKGLELPTNLREVAQCLEKAPQRFW